MVSIFGPILFLTLTVAIDERFIMDSAAQTISAVWFLLLTFSCFTLWLMKESISLHNGDVTPLQLCVLFGKYELVSLLCSEPFFGDPLIKDSSGYDSFLLAQRYVSIILKERDELFDCCFFFFFSFFNFFSSFRLFYFLLYSLNYCNFNKYIIFFKFKSYRCWFVDVQR